jgi:hypothetical protein
MDIYTSSYVFVKDSTRSAVDCGTKDLDLTYAFPWWWRTAELVARGGQPNQLAWSDLQLICTYVILFVVLASNNVPEESTALNQTVVVVVVDS